MKIWVWLTACICLGACGPLAERKPLFEGVQGLVSGAEPPGANQQADARETLSREQIDSADVELLLFAPADSESSVLLAHAATNGARRTWASDEAISLTLHDGVIVASRGLGNDLMGADAAAAHAAIVAGQGASTRVHDYLDGEDQITQRTYNCTASTERVDDLEIFGRIYETRVVKERCEGERIRFQNLYWVDGVGTIRQSRQWLSPQVGLLDLQRL